MIPMPTNNTFPLGNNVAVCNLIAGMAAALVTGMAAALVMDVHLPEVGLYITAEEQSAGFPIG